MVQPTPAIRISWSTSAQPRMQPDAQPGLDPTGTPPTVARRRFGDPISSGSPALNFGIRTVRTAQTEREPVSSCVGVQLARESESHIPPSAGAENDVQLANHPLKRSRAPSLKEVHLQILRQGDEDITRDRAKALFDQLTEKEKAELEKIKSARAAEVRAHNALCPPRGLQPRMRRASDQPSDEEKTAALAAKRAAAAEKAAQKARAEAEAQTWVPIPESMYEAQVAHLTKLTEGVREGHRMPSAAASRDVFVRMDALMRNARLNAAEDAARRGGRALKHEGLIFQGCVYELLWDNDGDLADVNIAADNGIPVTFVRLIVGCLWGEYWKLNDGTPKPPKPALKLGAMAPSEVLVNARTGGAALWRSIKRAQKDKHKYSPLGRADDARPSSHF